MLMYIFIDIMEVHMNSIKTFKFMNGWMVKEKHIETIKNAIPHDRKYGRTLGLEKLYTYGWPVKVEINKCLNFQEAVRQLRYVCGDKFIIESCGFVIMKAETRYLVIDITMLCESCTASFNLDNLYSLYDLLEGKF